MLAYSKQTGLYRPLCVASDMNQISPNLPALHLEWNSVTIGQLSISIDNWRA